jgi:hypothetical protein
MVQVEMQHICSLGNLCHTSMFHKVCGLKKESYPFDWIFSNVNKIKHCITDDFKTFLDRSLHTTRPKNKGGHMYYGANMFNHHNPKESDEHYNYFIRCVDRFRKLLKSRAPKLFQIIYTNKSMSIFEKIKKEVIELNDLLKTKTKNHNICVVLHICSTERNISVSEHENIKFIILNTLTTSHGRAFRNKDDDALLHKALFENYTFDVKSL